MAKRTRKSGPTLEKARDALGFEPVGGGGVFADAIAPPPKTYRTQELKVFGDRIQPGFLGETYGGGELEFVPGFRSKRAMTQGLDGTHEGEPQTFAMAPPHPGDPAQKRPANYETVYHDPHDDRVQIIDTARVPWRAVCHLRIVRETGHETSGTGWFAGPDLVVTAGHNYLNHHQGGWATSILITAGHDGTVDPPYPSVSPVSAYVPPNWVDQADPGSDYAFLHLPNDRLGRRTGYFAFADAPDTFLQGVLMNLPGYPYDKAYGTLWYNGGRIFQMSSSRVAYHIDTEGGCSGAPLIYTTGEKRIVLAMHTQGDNSGDGSRFNSGVRVTGTFFDELKQATGFA